MAHALEIKNGKASMKNVDVKGYLYAFVLDNFFYGMKKNGVAVIKSLL